MDTPSPPEPPDQLGSRIGLILATALAVTSSSASRFRFLHNGVFAEVTVTFRDPMTMHFTHRPPDVRSTLAAEVKEPRQRTLFDDLKG